MSAPFYSKGPGNDGYLKNIEVLAYDDLDGGSFFQSAMWKTDDGRYYLYGTMGPNIGIIEVTDPGKPRFVKKFQTIDQEKYKSSRNVKIQVADGLMITGMASGSGPWVPGQPKRPTMPAECCRQGIDIFDIKTDPENPKFLGYWDCGEPNSFGTHRFMYDGGRFVHTASSARTFEGNIYRCIDIKDPTHPVEAGRWWMPHQFADGYIGRTFDPNDSHTPEYMHKGWLHGAPFVKNGLAYCGYSGDGLVILNVEDVTRPYIVGQLPLVGPFGSYYGGATTHTALPLPDRDLCVVTNEGERPAWFVPNNDPNIPGKKIGKIPQALNNIHMVDVSDPSNPTLIAEFPYPEVPENFPFQNFQQMGLGVNYPFGPHNLHEPMPHKPWLEQRSDRIYCCYFAAGLRVYDISDEFVPKEIAYFIPPNTTRSISLPGPKVAVTEDLIVDERGYIYINTWCDGLYIVKVINN